MKIETTIDKDSGIRIQTVNGVVTKAPLLNYLQQLYAIPEFDSGPKAVWDFSHADLSDFTLPEVVSIRDFIEKGIDKKKPSSVALVVSKNLDFSLTTMFGTLIRSPDLKVRIFPDLASALNWLNG